MITKFDKEKSHHNYSTKHFNNVFDYHIYNLEKQAFKSNLTLEIKESNKDYLKIECTEDNHHKSTIILMEKGKTCSCREFAEKQLGRCKHIAVLASIVSDSRKYKDEFGTEVRRLVNQLKTYKTKEYTYTFYDSLKDEIRTIGRGPNIVDFTFGKKKSPMPEIGHPHIIANPFQLFDNITLMDYQRDILQKMLTVKRALCCMIMGSGKTLLSIGGIKEIGADDALIIAPKSVLGQWIKEIRRATGREAILLNKHLLDQGLDNGRIYVCTYQLFNRNVEKFTHKKYKLVICDEIQYIRNDSSKTWDSIGQLESEYFWGLSGTLIENDLDDLYNIMQIVEPSILSVKWKFDETFKQIKSISRTKVLFTKKVMNLPLLREKIKNHVLSYDNIKFQQYKPTIEKIDLDYSAQKHHDYYFEQAKRLIAKSLNQQISFAEKAMIQAFLLKARQSCNSSELITKVEDKSTKVDKIISIIKDICIKANTKIVIYSEWVEMLDILQREVNKLNVPNVKFHGQLTSKKRQEILDRFINDENIKIFFSSDAGGLGIDGLQKVCNHILHAEVPWNPAKIDQRNGRLNRMGQNKIVNTYQVIANNTIETSNLMPVFTDKKSLREEVIFGKIYN